MEEYTLNGIRRETIKRIFSVISQFKKITRHEIAEKTGLSLMTVGKITDILLDHKAVSYEKASTGSVGRRAEYINLADKLYELAIIITDTRISGYLTNFSLEEQDKFTLERTGEDINQILPELMGEVMSTLVENGVVGSCVGVGVVYNREEDAEAAKKLASELKEQLSLSVSSVSDLTRAVSLGCALSEKEEKLLYFRKSDSGYIGTLVKALECVLCGEIAENGQSVADAALAVCEFLSPGAVCIEGEKNFLSYNGKVLVADDKCACKYVCKGISHIVREEYVQN